MAAPPPKDSVLLLWAVDPLLPAAFGLVKAWGFEFKVGLGYRTRAMSNSVCLQGSDTRLVWRRMSANLYSGDLGWSAGRSSNMKKL
jgi:hypothetical protein